MSEETKKRENLERLSGGSKIWKIRYTFEAGGFESKTQNRA